MQTHWQATYLLSEIVEVSAVFGGRGRGRTMHCSATYNNTVSVWYRKLGLFSVVDVELHLVDKRCSRSF